MRNNIYLYFYLFHLYYLLPKVAQSLLLATFMVMREGNMCPLMFFLIFIVDTITNVPIFPLCSSPLGPHPAFPLSPHCCLCL